MENNKIGIDKVIELLNNKELDKKGICSKYGFTTRELNKLIKESDYTFNQSSKKYEIMESNIDLTKVTLRVPTDLYSSVKLQAIFENCNISDIINKALDKYIPQTTKDIIENNKK